MPSYISSCGGIRLDDTQFNIDEDKIIHVIGGDNPGTAVTTDEVETMISDHNTATDSHSDIRGDLETLNTTVSSHTTELSNVDDSLDAQHTALQNIIKGEYLGTTGMFIDYTKSDSGVQIDVTPMEAIADATTTDDIITQFNKLLSEMRNMGLIAES